MTYRGPAWGGLTIDDVRAAFEAQLGSWADRTYPGLPDDALYQPLADPALCLDREARARLGPQPHDNTRARAAYDRWLLLDWRAMCDPGIGLLWSDAYKLSGRTAPRSPRE